MSRIKTVLRAALAALLFTLAAPATADSRDIVPLPAHDAVFTLAELERAFWYCDYVATTKGVLAAPMAACRFATEQLMKAKFDGDFNALVQWWTLNKPAEHRRMATLVD